MTRLQDKITAWFGLAEGTSWTEIGRFAASVIWTGVKNKLIPWFQGLGVMLQEAFTGSETNQAELEEDSAWRTYQWYKDELAKNGSEPICVRSSAKTCGGPMLGRI